MSIAEFVSHVTFDLCHAIIFINPMSGILESVHSSCRFSNKECPRLVGAGSHNAVCGDNLQHLVVMTIVMKTKTFTVLANQIALLVSENAKKESEKQ